MNEIIPAILAADEQTFQQRLDIAKKLSPVVQVDVLDQTLYPESSWFDPLVAQEMDAACDLELHIMTSRPDKIIKACCGWRKVKRVIWHIEAHVDHAELLLLCQEYGFETGLALAPTTSVDDIEPFAEMVDEILVLGVEPGKSGQTLQPETIQKAHGIALAWPGVCVGFDGGVTAQSIPKLAEAGVSRFNAASAIFDAPNAKAAFEKLQNA